MWPSGYEKLQGSLEGRFFEVKAALAQELNISEIADKLDVQRKYVYQFIERHGFHDFVQPGKRKTEWREMCATRKRSGEEARKFDAENLIRVYSRVLFDEMKNQGFQVEYEDVLGEVHLTFVKAMGSYSEKRGASFKTYLQTALLDDFKNFKKKLARGLKRQGFTEVGQKSAQPEQSEKVAAE